MIDLKVLTLAAKGAVDALCGLTVAMNNLTNVLIELQRALDERNREEPS